MKTLHNKIKIVIGVFVITALAVSCVPKTETMGDVGQTLLKLTPSVYNMVAFDAKTTPQTGLLFEVRRDVPNGAVLNTTATVVLKYDTDTAILKKYNSKHATTFIPLPPSLGTVSPAITAGNVTLDFAAGDFAKSVNINVPSAGSFDFSKHYALAFRILSVTGGTLSAAVNDTIVAEILAKNKWDGIYDVSGSYVDYIYAPGAYAGYYPKTIQLRTTGALTCSRYDADYATYGYIFDPTGAGTSASYFGNWYPYFVFDVSDNVVDCINSYADPLPRQRTALLYKGAGSINKYFAATKTMDVTFQLKALNTSPQIRNLITEHYVYKGPR